MGQKTARSRELAALSARVGQWRKESGGGRGSRIPAALWADAGRVASTAGLYPTARALRFSYARLKERCRATCEGASPAMQDSDVPGAEGALAQRKKPSVVASTEDGLRRRSPMASGAARTPRFVALPMPTEQRSITIELAGAKGDHLRVEVRGDFDVTDLVQRVRESYVLKQRKVMGIVGNIEKDVLEHLFSLDA